MKDTILKAENITKYFYEPEKFKVVNNVSFEIERKSFVSIVGKSGSGKSTLLYILSTMDTDYEGSVYIHDKKLTGLDLNTLARFRNENIGFVFQFHYLLPHFTSLENVMIPALRLGKFSKEEIQDKAYNKLRLLEMQDFALKPSHKLSGGQQQRVAIARALINDPMIIMGDEPTGNLDSKNSRNVFDIFRELTRTQNQSIIVVTHDEEFARNTDRIIEMSDGEILSPA
jgi:lipoprotein-releasing system ATP-binding protein